MSHHNKQVASCDWRTPQPILERVRRALGGVIGLDPATSEDNPTGALQFFTEREDGLVQNWDAALERAGVWTMFVNPPWSKKRMPLVWWAAPIWDFATTHPDVPIITIMPASVGSTWWHDFVGPAPRHMLPRGRINYDPPPSFEGTEAWGPTFDTCITYWGPDPEAFDREFGDMGKMIV